MKKLLLGSVALIALSAAANAADIAPSYTKAPPVVAQIYDWSGFYVGAYAGVGASKNRGFDPTSSNTNEVFEPNGYGFNGGGTLGYNWQLGAAPLGLTWVVGVEGDIGYLDTSRSAKDWDDFFLYDSKTSLAATVRGRIGLSNGPTLSYLTGGYAAVQTKDVFTSTDSGLSVSSDKTRSGYAIGSGTETMLGGGWTAKSEALYMDVSGGSALLVPTGGYNVEIDRHRYYSQRFGVNYLFGAKNVSPGPQTNWNGFFAGLTGGSAVGNTHATDVPFSEGTLGVSDGGYSVGGQIGYNWMINPKWVLGAEGDISYLGINHTSGNYHNSAFAGTDTSWIATARGRIGYSTGPALLYATAGGAWVNVKDSFNWGTPATTSKTQSGYAVGGGIETVLSGNWTMKSEYLFVDVGHGDPLTSGGSTVSFDHQYHLFRTGLTYRFDTGAPVLAKY